MPPLVQNCLVPLSTYPSATRVARDFIESASEPESGSVRPSPPSTNRSGFVNSGRHRLDADGDAGAAPAQLLVDDELGQEVEPLAPVLVGQERRRAEAQLVRLLDDLVRELLGLVVLGSDGPDLPFSELVGQVSDRLLLLGERELERHGTYS